jgi:hypothetical protein
MLPSDKPLVPNPAAWAAQRMLSVQPDIVLQQNPPVQNQWYTIIDTLIAGLWDNIMLIQVNGIAAAQTIALKVTTDDYTVNWAGVVLPNNTREWLTGFGGGNAFLSATACQVSNYHGSLYFHRLKVEIRMTSAPAVGQTLTEILGYELYGVP